jgi:hypothetical protein
MNKLLVFLLSSSLCVLSACQSQTVPTETPELCTESWYHAVESAIPSGDGMGHGPDIGTEEWKSVIEFKLGIRGNPNVPDRNRPEWCNYINEFI